MRIDDVVAYLEALDGTLVLRPQPPGGERESSTACADDGRSLSRQRSELFIAAPCGRKRDSTDRMPPVREASPARSAVGGPPGRGGRA